ncbi:MAG: 50S ribosomal protein L23 [Patescibacteria group bacterium]|nr:50S ribosomal protein L23 [Patescibacteria group bacterium]
MGLFNKKIEEKKKPAVASAKVNNAKSAVKMDEEAKSMKDLYGAAEAGKTKSTVKAGEKKSVGGNAYKIIMKPLVTEKVSGLGALNKYVFAVAKNANKIEVAKAIKEIYGIKPIGVNVIRMSGKKTRYGRISGRRKDWKKAIITLPKGEAIKIYEGV